MLDGGAEVVPFPELGESGSSLGRVCHGDAADVKR
jgi:hypothetical protein